MKRATRLYPVDVALLPWSPLGEHGVLQQVLTSDADGAAVTRLLTLPAGVAWDPPASASLWRELYVLDGAVAVDGVALAAGSFVARAPGADLPRLQALAPTRLIELQELGRPGGDKAEATLDAAAVAALPWIRPDGAPEGIVHRILTDGPSGSATRVLRVLPFVATGVFVHDHAEEVLLLEGSYKMGDEHHATGTYTAKGPDVPHGPFLTHEGYVGLEVRNYA